MYYVKKVLDMFIKVSQGIMVFLMSVMVVSMFFQVVSRYVFGAGIPWTEELARFSNVWLVFLGASMLAYGDEHIKVTVLDDMLKKGKTLDILKIIRSIIYFVYSIVIIKVGISSLAVVASQTSPNMLVPMNYIYMVIPIGAIITVIYLAVNFVPKRKGENNIG